VWPSVDPGIHAREVIAEASKLWLVTACGA